MAGDLNYKKKFSYCKQNNTFSQFVQYLDKFCSLGINRLACSPT